MRKTIITMSLSLLVPFSLTTKPTNEIPGQFVSSPMVEEAVLFELPPVDTKTRNESEGINKKAMDKVRAIDYEGALATVFYGLKQYPSDFALQSKFATLLGDHSNNYLSPLKEKMAERSKSIFKKLMNELEGQPRETVYGFKNEYYWFSAQYKKQYELGIQQVNEYWGTDEWASKGVRGYYSQGVGAAYYARELLKRGKKTSLAHDYAQKAVVAWAQYFSYKNDYYNSYVHYALALGILGYKVEMMRALEHSAALSGQDLSYMEFQEVLQFFEEYEARTLGEKIKAFIMGLFRS